MTDPYCIFCNRPTAHVDPKLGAPWLTCTYCRRTYQPPQVATTGPDVDSSAVTTPPSSQP